MKITKDIQEQYTAIFSNLDQVAHPSIWSDPRFWDLVKKAIERDSALTQKEVEEVFGPLSWDW